MAKKRSAKILTLPPLHLAPDNLAQDTEGAAGGLHSDSKKGHLIGMAFVGVYRGGEYVCNTAGWCRENNASTIGMVRVLGSMLEAKERGL